MLSRAKILVAGRDASVDGALATALDHAGLVAQVVHVESGDEAIEILSASSCDCALLDATMSGAESLSVLRRADSMEIATPFILVTGQDGSLSASEAHDAGAFDCLAVSELGNGRLSRSLLNAVRVARAERQASLNEQLLFHQATHDPLTGVPNRTLFSDRLGNAIALAQREERDIAVLVVDVNRFGEVNKTLGHAIGDRLLEEVALRLREVMRSSDTVARLAGDEFAVLLSSISSINGALNASSKIIEALKEPLSLDGHRLSVGASVGIAVYPAHGGDAVTLIRNGGNAMSQAKRNNSGYAIFSGDNANASLHEMSLASDLHQACGKGELVLHYQPVVSLSSGQLCGAEALLRWEHPEHGLISPSDFIPIAERTGEIEQLTLWVIDSVLRQCHVWAAPERSIPISVNLSAVTLHNPDFSRQVAELFIRWQVPVNRLKFEITESAIISDAARATETVNELHRQGIKIVIDDFGTGYTSIAYLRRMPVVEVKVDKSYVLNMRQNQDDAVIVRSIVDLAHNLGLQVVAEGVEDGETLSDLSELGCDAVQGFYLGRPVESTAFDAW